MIRLGASGVQAQLPFSMFDGSSNPALDWVWNDIGSGITSDFLVRHAGATVYSNATIARLFQHGDGGAHYELAQSETLTAGKVYYRWAPSQAYVVADQVVTFDTTDNEVDWTAHGQYTGNGPFRFITTGGLPAGLAVATDYWVIRRNDNSFSLASTKVNAFSNVEIDMTSAGSGTQTIQDTASTRQMLVDYDNRAFEQGIESEGIVQAGTAQAGAATTITLAPAASSSNGRYVNGVIVLTGGVGAGQIGQITGYVGATRVATVADTWATNPDNTTTYEVLPGMSPGAAALATIEGRNVEGSYKLGDLVRLMVGVLSGKASNYETDTVAMRNLADSKTRVTFTYDSTGRLTVTIGDLTA